MKESELLKNQIRAKDSRKVGFYRELRVGDIIFCQGTRATVGKIYVQYTDTRDCDIEFEDKMGMYRHWKSWADGGYVLYVDKINQYYRKDTGTYLVPVCVLENDSDLFDEVMEMISKDWVLEFYKEDKDGIEGFEVDAYSLTNIESGTAGIVPILDSKAGIEHLAELQHQFVKDVCPVVSYDAYLGSENLQKMVDYSIQVPQNWIYKETDVTDYIALRYNKGNNTLEFVVVKE